MAKTTAPLLSFNAKGQIGKTMVNSTWRGVKYARAYVVPANPNTLAQQSVRKLFAYLREMWKIAPPAISVAWDSFAQGRPFTGMNKWVGENVRVMNGEVDCNNIIFSPGAKGGLPPENILVESLASGAVTITATAPTAPQGWVFRSLVAAAFQDQDPTGIFTGPFIAGEDMTSAYSITLTGLGAATPVQVGVWATWTKPNGSIAYSVSQTTQITTDA